MTADDPHPAGVLRGSSKPLGALGQELARDDAVALAWRGLEFAVDVRRGGFCGLGARTERKAILKGLAGRAPPGRLVACMGPSGSGKTSLINLLSGRGAPTAGRVFVNGERASPATLRRIGSFVQQDDCLLETLTVREVLATAAAFTLPRRMTKAEKAARVDDAVALLRLHKCTDTLVGSPAGGTKGISGGERKRTSVAIELISNPRILFLDEPTSGLDANMAASLVKTLQALSATGRPVVASVHQPSSEIYFLFDDLVLLLNGSPVYVGSIKQSISYFSVLGFPTPQFSNPADFIFTQVLTDTSAASAAASAADLAKLIDETARSDDVREAFLVQAWETSSERKGLTASLAAEAIEDAAEYKLQSTSELRATVGEQALVLTARAVKNILRNRLLIPAMVGQAFFFALLTAVIWVPLPMDNAAGIQDRAGLLFFTTTNPLFGNTIGILSTFANERSVVLREQTASMYSVPAYFGSKMLVEFPLRLVIPFVSASCTYWIVGLQRTAAKWFIYSAIDSVVALCGSGLGILIASVFPDIAVALQVAPVIILPLMIFSGLFIQYKSIPPWFAWISYLSPIQYGYAARMQNEFDGLVFECPDSEFLGADGRPTCPIPTGEEYIRQVDLDQFSIAQNFGLLAALYVGFHLAGLASFVLLASKQRLS